MSLVGPVEQEVLEPGQRSIPELIKTINEEHQAGGHKAAEAIMHWVAAGEALQTVRSRVERGQWDDWCADNLDFGAHNANRYMRLARYRDVLYGAEKMPTDMDTASALLAGLPAKERNDAVPNAIKERARALRNEGLTYYAIGEMLGYHTTTICRWIDPSRADRDSQTANKRRSEAREAARIQQETARAKAVARAAKSRGGAIAKMYTDVERMQDTLGQARLEIVEPDAREALERAGEHYRKMRDEIVRALGVS